MTTKNCTICKQDLPVDDFYRDRTPIHTISYFSKCKPCYNKQVSERKKIEPDLSITSKKCSICNIEQTIDNYYKSYRHKDGYFKWCSKCHEIKTKNKGNNKKIKRTPEYMREYNKKRLEDISHSLKYMVRSNLHTYLRRNLKSSKQNSTLKYLGCSIEFLKKWFELNFDGNMTWKNRGNYWHIDHIKPCSSFDLTNQDDIYKCYNWTNLRPLEKNENILKSDKIDIDLINNFEAKSKEFLKNITYNIEDNLYVLLPEVKNLPLTISEEPGELTGNP
jgi:hypothetical protein